MSAFLELIKETPPEDMQEAAEIFRRYLQKKQKEAKPPKLLSLTEFQKRLKTDVGIEKRKDWLRNDLFAQCPALKDYAFGLNAGRGHRLKIDEEAITWISKHKQLIDWRG